MSNSFDFSDQSFFTLIAISSGRLGVPGEMSAGGEREGVKKCPASSNVINARERICAREGIFDKTGRGKKYFVVTDVAILQGKIVGVKD